MSTGAPCRARSDEQQALIEAVIVPETWFFRYPESFATLAKLASKRLAAINNMRALRILSLPCSTGEEPYSIAMALLDAGLKPHQFKVDGMDVSPLSVEKARRALYGKNSFRGQDIDFSRPAFHAPRTTAIASALGCSNRCACRSAICWIRPCWPVSRPMTSCSAAIC